MIIADEPTLVKKNPRDSLTDFCISLSVREILDADDMEKAFFTQWVLREAYIKWTGEGLSRDLRTIPMDKGNYIMLEMEPGYSGAIWSRDSLELRFEYEDIILR